jgi:hypothetical protein
MSYLISSIGSGFSFVVEPIAVGFWGIPAGLWKVPKPVRSEGELKGGN